jgi:hypothetical protein
MASNAKKKTTMAKLNRERRLRERRAEKQAKKEARKLGLLPEQLDPADEAAVPDDLVEPSSDGDIPSPDSDTLADPDQ